MSMTYYAVTDDPNELAHFGIKGMKWGVRHDKPRHPGSHRPRSAAYKKAQNKLSAAMKNGIKAVERKWNTYNSPINKQIRAERRYEKQTNRALEKARKGKLKYGKLTDDQVYRITERLALERNARQLSEAEKTWGKRLRESIGEGVIAGVGSGVGRIVSEKVSRRSTLKTDRLRAEQQNQLNREFERQKDRYENSQRRLKEKARDAVNADYYRTAYEEGDSLKYRSADRRAKYLADVKKRNKDKDYSANIQKIYDEQSAKVRAQNDAKLLDDDKRGNRKNVVKMEPTQVKYLDPITGKSKTGSAVQALDAWNTAHENVNKYGNAYYDSMNNSLAKIKADEAHNREIAKRDKAFNEAMRSKQQQDAQRESARIQREQERQARISGSRRRRDRNGRR